MFRVHGGAFYESGLPYSFGRALGRKVAQQAMTSSREPGSRLEGREEPALSAGWPSREGAPALTKDGVQVWRLDLSIGHSRAEVLLSLLSTDEVARAQRYRVEQARRNFVVCRAALRLLLACYEGGDPRSFTFAYNEMGRPELPQSDVCFSVSHSGDAALLAFTRGRRLGVDIERVRPVQDMDYLVEMWFSRREQEIYASLQPCAKQEAFFNGWTRKEAFIKALGKGLAHSLKSFDVEIAPHVRPCFYRMEGEGVDLDAWALYDLAAPAGYKAALAVEDRFAGVCVQSWQFSRGEIG